MPYSQAYSKFISTEIVTSKTRVRPRKIYRIVSYVYADGHTESFSGTKGVLVFVLGKYNDKLYCLKISELQPKKFFLWLRTIMFKKLTEEKLHDLKWLENLIPKSDRAGIKLFSTAVKGKPIYRNDPSIFRTYIIKNIKQIMWVELKTSELEKMFGFTHNENLDNTKDKAEEKVVISPNEKKIPTAEIPAQPAIPPKTT